MFFISIHFVSFLLFYRSFWGSVHTHEVDPSATATCTERCQWKSSFTLLRLTKSWSQLVFPPEAKSNNTRICHSVSHFHTNAEFSRDPRPFPWEMKPLHTAKSLLPQDQQNLLPNTLSKCLLRGRGWCAQIQTMGTGTQVLLYASNGQNAIYKVRENTSINKGRCPRLCTVNINVPLDPCALGRTYTFSNGYMWKKKQGWFAEH